MAITVYELGAPEPALKFDGLCSAWDNLQRLAIRTGIHETFTCKS